MAAKAAKTKKPRTRKVTKIKEEIITPELVEKPKRRTFRYLLVILVLFGLLYFVFVFVVFVLCFFFCAIEDYCQKKKKGLYMF